VISIVPKVATYCHDGMGLGHLNRTLALSHAMTSQIEDLTVLVMTGCPHTDLFGPMSRIDWLKLPAIRKCEDGGYCPRSLSIDLRRMINWRAALLLESVKRYRPDILLVDKSPIGVCSELVPALRWLKKYSPNTTLIFGMRDIEDGPAQTIHQWSKRGVRFSFNEVYDRIWVYGTQALFDVGERYQLSSKVIAKTEYLGHVASLDCQCHAGPAIQPTDILVTVGGGTDGRALIEKFIDCLPKLEARGLSSCIIGGPDLPLPARKELRSRVHGRSGVHWMDFEPCMGCRIEKSKLVICMGGYNTMTSVARLGKLALVVPRRGPREEQMLRARLWTEAGLVNMLDPIQLSADRLTERVIELIDRPSEARPIRLKADACDRAAAIISDILTTEKVHAASVCL